MSALTAATLGAIVLSSPVMAETSATAGFVSDYVFRGAGAGDGGANGSVDWSNDSGFALGAWAIDDGNGPNDGMEVDIYGSYSQEKDNFSWSVGFTRYEYTWGPGFQTEINLGLDVGKFGLALDSGKNDSTATGAVDNDYRHIAVTYAVNDVYGIKLAQMDPDTDADDDQWNYFEVSASGQVSELDVSMTLGTSSEGDAKSLGQSDGYLTLSVSKSFDGLGF